MRTFLISWNGVTNDGGDLTGHTLAKGENLTMDFLMAVRERYCQELPKPTKPENVSIQGVTELDSGPDPETERLDWIERNCHSVVGKDGFVLPFPEDELRSFIDARIDSDLRDASGRG